MSTPLKEHELRYSKMEKHTYAVLRSLKTFRFYVLYSHSIVYVPDSSVKSILTQQEIGCNTRGALIEKVQEYDINLKPTKLMWRNGLCKIIIENQDLSQEDEPSRALMVSLQDPWFSNIVYFLIYEDRSNGLIYKQKRDLRIKSAKYVRYDDQLYKRVIDGTFLRCVDKPQQERLLHSFHNKACGGPFFINSYSIQDFEAMLLLAWHVQGWL